MKIQLIRKLVELDGGQFFEVFPGPYKGRAWNEQSVYIEEEAFMLFEAVLKKHAPDFDHFANTAISKDAWNGIISDLQEFRTALIDAKSMQDLPGTIRFLYDGSRDSFSANVQENASKTVTLIDELIEWLSKELESQTVISILGI